MKPHSQKFLQKRKFAMVLPMLVLPFVTMIFWALGGGQGSPTQAKSAEKVGLNLDLPDAHFNDEKLNKLLLYDQAKRDSLKLEEAQKNDPYFDLPTVEEQKTQEEQQEPVQKKTRVASTNTQRTVSQRQPEIIDPNEAKVNQKLEELYRELNKKQESPVDIQAQAIPTANQSDPQVSSDVKHLEKMMDTMNSGNQADPEMQKIDGMLEKILDIQHPDRMNERIKEESKLKKGQVFPVETKQAEDNFSLISGRRVEQPMMDSSALLSKVFSVQPKQNSFYGLDDEINTEQETNKAIDAVIHDTQELVAGSTVKMRLLNDVYINGKLISKGQFIYGVCSINGERLTVKINSIRDDSSLFPVSLSAYDLDGIEGLYIPGAITRDVAKQSSDQALQGMQLMTLDQSLQAQATAAGIQTAKSLFSKKVKLIKVMVKAGYKILLKDDNART